eukprot:5913903-Pleurochrysis_carterae.AAC.1
MRAGRRHLYWRRQYGACGLHGHDGQSDAPGERASPSTERMKATLRRFSGGGAAIGASQIHAWGGCIHVQIAPVFAFPSGGRCSRRYKENRGQKRNWCGNAARVPRCRRKGFWNGMLVNRRNY